MFGLSCKSLKKIDAEHGFFAEFVGDTAFSENSFLIGEIEGMTNYTATYRFNACWMKPVSGGAKFDDLEEIQYLIATDGKQYCLLYALIDKVCRTSFYTQGGKLYALCETEDDATKVASTIGLYCITGKDPYELNHLAHEDIVKQLGTCNLLSDKIKPKFLDKFGFCTYNALYDNVTEETVDKLLCVFKENDLKIGFLLIDAGWQNTDGFKFAGFAPNPEKFPHGLKYTIQTLKEKYGLSEVLCWHTFIGYWTGLLKENFPEYKIEYIDFHIPEHTQKLMNQIENSDTTATAGFNFYSENTIHEKWGVVNTDLYRFYFDFYSYLRNQGVDGSKLDAMCWMEGLGQNRGGRVKAMRELVSSLEGSSAVNFNMEHINCSCNSNDFIYNSLKSTVMRSSIDFFENIGESHGIHLYTNAHTSFWLGEMFIPDWDMFMSGIEAGEMHAMSRAISGGPIYCSDNLESINFDVIARLTDGKGGVCRCMQPARVTLDNMFVNPTVEQKLLKVFNRNRFGYVLGAFCCYYDKEKDVPVTDTVALKDIYHLPNGQYAVWSYQNGYMGIFDQNAKFDVTLGRFGGDIFTVMPLRHSVAVIGVTDKYNPAAFIEKQVYRKGELAVCAKADGELTLISEQKPASATVPFTYENQVIKTNCKAGETIRFQF